MDRKPHAGPELELRMEACDRLRRQSRPTAALEDICDPGLGGPADAHGLAGTDELMGSMISACPARRGWAEPV